MNALIFGGSACGKSGYAEELATSLHQSGPLLYVATMEPYGAEERIARHRSMREGKGFVTLEYPRVLAPCQIPQGSTILLEDLGNLTANEMFSSEMFCVDEAQERIWTGLQQMAHRAEHLVVVSNDVHRDGEHCDANTMAYCQVLAELHRRLAQNCEQVIELVCGLPIFWKGGGL